ncbi:hypothetical protein [Engelhardtia mirabilis]
MRRRITTALCAIALAACSSTAEVKEGSPKGFWVAPSAVMEAQIRDEAERLPWTRGIERMEQIRWFASLGEPAYEILLELLADPRDDVAASALSALGATGDRRLVSHIRAVPFDKEQRGLDLRLERARTLLRLGDWGEVPELIAGLSDKRLLTRALCAQALQESTNESFGFDPKADETARQLAVDRWERWWLRFTGDPLKTRG